MAQKYTEARKEGNRRWDAKNLDRISLAMPKGKKEVIQAAAKKSNESVNAFINRLIDAELERLDAEAGGGFHIDEGLPDTE